MSILIVGGGEIGRFIAEKLIQEKKAVVIIEKSERVLDEIEESLDAKFVLGNGASPRVLREAGLEKAEMVVAVTNSDEANILATIIAGMEAPQAVRIARIRNPEFDLEGETFQDAMRINLLINPEKEAASAILKVLQMPGAIDILDFFDGEIKLVGTTVLRSSPLINRPLQELDDLRDRGHFLIAAIFRGNQLIVPSGENRIMPGDTVYYVADSEYVSKGMRLLGHRGEKTGEVMIHGGTFIGMNLARSLEERGLHVKIIESDPKLCSALSRQLDHTLILNAAGTDEEVLEQENIAHMDAFVAVTKDDEDNIISALLAKRLGAPMAIALSHKSAYRQLISSIGIDVVVNPRQLANNVILQYIRRGKVLHVSNLREQAEIIEAEALETTDLVGKPLADLKLPNGTLVLSLKRGDEIIVPWGDTVIEPGDRVLLLARREEVPNIEKFITVKMEYF